MDNDVEEPVSVVVCRSSFLSHSYHGSRSSSRQRSTTSSRYGSRSSSIPRLSSDHGLSTKGQRRSSNQPDPIVPTKDVGFADGVSTHKFTALTFVFTFLRRFLSILSVSQVQRSSSLKRGIHNALPPHRMRHVCVLVVHTLLWALYNDNFALSSDRIHVVPSLAIKGTTERHS